MKMSIDDNIRELMWVRKVNEEILKTDAKELDIDSDWIKHWENVIKSLDVAIETMRKYQKIQEIIEVWHQDIYAKDFECIAEVAEVIADENDTRTKED